MHTILTYLWESGPLKYLQKVEPGSKIPIECISGLENICFYIPRIPIMHTVLTYLLMEFAPQISKNQYLMFKKNISFNQES